MEAKSLIFSLARCGSETLVSVLNCHPQICCVSEPFNRDNFEGRYHNQVKDAASLREALHDIWNEYTGIKHVWDPSGWPFTDLPQFNRLILQAPGQKIIFLTRQNSLKRIVSLCMAEQTKRWGVLTDEDRDAVAAFPFTPLHVPDFRWHLEGEKSLVPEYRKILLDQKCESMELLYEDLFAPSHTLEERIKVIAKILSFLGKTEIKDPDALTRVTALLQKRPTAVDSALLYHRIPNIEEIEKEFGSPETGSLFETPVPTLSA